MEPTAAPLDALFAEAWAAYPSRPNNSRTKARRAWEARVKAKVDPAVILDGVRRYAAYVLAEQIEPRFVKMAATFFGPDEHYLADYAVAPSPKRIDAWDADLQRMKESPDVVH